MQKELKQLELFHRAFGRYYQKTPSINVPSKVKNLRIKLMKEELLEVIEAITDRQGIHDLAKELADLVYVSLGTVIAFGLQDRFEEIFTAVHDSNMSKLDNNGNPVYRDDGKVIKSNNYEEPDIRSIIDK